MNREQAAKLAQAYQWLSEGKEVEWCYNNGEWEDWSGLLTFPHEYRLKPIPLECWVNQYPDELGRAWEDLEGARRNSHDNAIRIAVHMREVLQLDIKAMVERFLTWKLPDDFYPDGGITFKPLPIPPHTWPTGTNLLHAGQAEQMIRHILGEDK